MKREIRITLLKKEILTGALGNLRLVGQGQEGASAEHAALLQSGDLPEDMAQLTGAMKSAWRQLLAGVGEWVKDGREAADNAPMSPSGHLEVVLLLTSNYSHVSTDLMADAMHRYMVDRTTGEWLTRVSLELATPWIEKSTADLLDLRTGMWQRQRAERPHVEPAPIDEDGEGGHTWTVEEIIIWLREHMGMELLVREQADQLYAGVEDLWPVAEDVKTLAGAVVSASDRADQAQNDATRALTKADDAKTTASIQADWEESDWDSVAYIKHKPALAEVATSGAYDDLIGKPVVPTRVGQLTNDAGYVTSSTLSGYATKQEMTEVATQVGVLSESVNGMEDDVESLEQAVQGKADVSHTHPHTSITDWDAATASFLTTTTAAATYLSKTDAAATYATKASVPTKTSDLTNDSGYITTASLSGYATQEEVENAKLEAIKNSLPIFDGTNDFSDYEVIDDYPDDSVYANAIVSYDISTDQFILLDHDNERCYNRWKAFGLYSSWENYKTYYEDYEEYATNAKLYYADGAGMMYCWDNDSFFHIQPKVENVSELTNDSGFVNTSGVNSIINSRMEVISRSAYNALTPTQQASKIYFIYEDSNSSAS